MIYEDTGNFTWGPLVPGQAHNQIDRFFECLGQTGVTGGVDVASEPTLTTSTPLAARLKSVQDNVSAMSMHLPSGFAPGLRRQFANLMDEDAWEDEDEFVTMEALTVFLMMLIHTKTKRRPGIGTNGRGSITASWTEGDNRLTIECLPSAKVSLVLSRAGDGGDIERAVFGPMRPERLCQVLVPFNPGVWFDC